MEQKRNSELTHKQKFSSASRRYPGSPRNRIIQACCFRDHPDDIVYDCLFNIAVGFTRARYQRKYKINSRSNLKGKRRSLEKVMADMEKVLLLFSLVDIATVM